METKDGLDNLDVQRLQKYIPVSIIIILSILIIFTGFYTVSAESVGVVQRFGNYHKVEAPGLHFKIPLGVDTVREVPIRRQLKEEFGFGSAGASFTSQVSDTSQWELETTMVTGDLNTALVEWVIQFRIEDAFDYLFKVREPGDALRDISESVMREVIGDRTVDEVLTIGRQEIELTAQIKMQEVVNLYEMGLQIDQVQLKDVNPPEPVQASFDEVNEAQQERERMINVSRGEYNKAVPLARGTAEQAILSAQGYAIQRINQAEGDAAKFNALFVEFEKAPEVTKRRLYLEVLGEVLPEVESKFILDESATSVLPLLQIGNASRGIVQ
tara:strand:- start:74117 stop:75100 length:984 start_codon:yes stop_codon:yes gene_type:complete